MAVVSPEGTTILARFRDARAAEGAARTYAQMALGAWPDARPDGTRTAARPAGDVAKLVVAGRTLLVLTGPDEASLDARLRASRAVVPQEASLTTPVGIAGDPTAAFWLYRPGVLPSFAVLLTGLAVLLFFRGVPWASTIEPCTNALPISRAELRGRLLALNDIEAPFVVSEADDGRLVVDWRFADARWLDLARAHGMRHVHRILLELDEDHRTVRPTEQATRFAWAAGSGAAAVRWSTNVGIVLFQRETQRVFGLQLDEFGRLEPRLSYSYRFDLQEMKAPLVAAVTRAGWRWRPTLWHRPRWLHWLTR
jgi:hypothetical protein